MLAAQPKSNAQFQNAGYNVLEKVSHLLPAERNAVLCYVLAEKDFPASTMDEVHSHLINGSRKVVISYLVPENSADKVRTLRAHYIVGTEMPSEDNNFRVPKWEEVSSEALADCLLDIDFPCNQAGSPHCRALLS